MNDCAGDECDLETLTALLDSDNDEEAESLLPSNSKHQVNMSGDMEDEVDDAELQRLVALVEPHSSVQTAGSKTVESECQQGMEAKTKTDAELLAELELMQEKIRLIQAQLSSKSAGITGSSTPVEQRSVVAGAVSVSSLNNSPMVTPTDGKCNNISLQGKRVLKDLDENIFFKKGVRVAHKPAANHTSAGLHQDSDSDCDDLSGEKQSLLSEAGKQLNSLIKSRQSSISYEGNKTLPASSKSVSKTIGSAPPPSRPTVKNNAREENSTDMYREPMSGIRVVKPLVSSDRLKSMMDGRRLIHLSRIRNSMRGSDIDGDWVTLAVIVHKVEPKVSSKGNKYSIWRLCDLADCDKIVSLFLFGKVHADLWKLAVGSVIGVLNAKLMPNNEKHQSAEAGDMSITVDASQKVLLIGYSKDLGFCQSVTKAGKICNNVVNTLHGEHCAFHVQAAYKKQCGKRAELQASYSGVEPKKSTLKKLVGSSSMFYGGKDYGHASSGSKKREISLSAYQSHCAKTGATPETSHTTATTVCDKSGTQMTLVHSVSEALSMSKKSVTKPAVKSDSLTANAAHNTAATAESSSARNMKTDGSTKKSMSHSVVGSSPPVEKCSSAQSSDVPVTSSVSRQVAEDDAFFLDLLARPTAGSRQFVNYLEKKEKESKTGNSKGNSELPSKETLTRTKSMKASEVLVNMAKSREPQNRLSVGERASTLSTASKIGCVATPQLGRGLKLDENNMIDLFDEPCQSASKKSSPAMTEALKAVRARGGIEKQDPNAIRKESRNPEYQDRIRKRVDGRSEEDSAAMADSVSDESPCAVSDIDRSYKKAKLKSPAGSAAVKRPSSGDNKCGAQKKLRRVGNMELTESEIQKLISAKSSHAALVHEAEAERQEEYFNVLEKTEKLEAKMDSIREVPCTAYTCVECKYTALKAADRCRSEGHKIKSHPATKRFFRCKDCSQRTISLDRLPGVACSKCGSSNYERVSMLNPKKGPKLPEEELLLRGVEEKFLS